MSCEIHTSALVENLNEVQSFFGLSGIKDKSWLHGVYIAICNDFLCFGYGSKIVILNSKYDKDQQQKVFGNSSRNVQLEDENQIITSISSTSIIGGSSYVDWICIMVGLSTGDVEFYSENGTKLYQKQLHNESVINMRIVAEEIIIFYPSCIIVIQMDHLVPLLKTLKEMYSKSKTTKVDQMDKDFMLTFKKWDYRSKEIVISDALMIPQQKTCVFDHLVSESLELGFTKKYRITPSQHASIITIGSKPFLSFHSAREGFRQNVFTDVAKAVVNKITSRLPSWLTGSQSQQSVERVEDVENVCETLYSRYELNDYQRLGCNIYLAPLQYSVAVATDNLGRILLIDTSTGIAIRMWKGYREAQCGFIEITEARKRKEQFSEFRRSGLFLIIYAPRKAIIEIWCLRKGPKIATFQACKNGFLIYNCHDGHKLSKSNRTSCQFFDADDNSLKTFSIPFHCILSEANSKSAEDFHYLKRLKILLKNVDFTDENTIHCITELLEKFKTPEIKLKCLELLTSYRKSEPMIIKKAIEIFLKSLLIDSKDGGNDENEGKESSEIQDEIYRNQLSTSCHNYKSLIECYLLAKGQSKDCETSKNEDIELMDNEYLTVQRIAELMSLTKNKEHAHGSKNVTFKDNEESIVSFLTGFVVHSDSIFINNEHQKNAYDQIGSVLFTNAWFNLIPMTNLLDIFALSRINSEDIMKCFLNFWLQQDVTCADENFILAEMTKFKEVLTQVCLYAGGSVTYAYNSICLFWQNVREYLLESSNPINSLLAAIICKNFALKKQDESQEFGFEQVTQEECQWTLLTEKLNDVAVLSIFINQFASSNTNHKYDVPNISLKKILNDGKGIISELVASWLIGVDFPINLIFTSSSDENIETDKRNVIKKLEILREYFPYSLNAAVILCHVIWELLSARWSKKLSEIQYLKNGIEYLGLFEEKDYHLKQGLCVLLWNANFKIPLKATQKLINKTGRLPREKLCLQHTMIPDFLMPQFLEQTLVFLEHFRSCTTYNKLEFKCEEILTQGYSVSSLSLIELIMQQQSGNLPLLNLHFEMVKVLELIAFLGIKYRRPMETLFDEVCNKTFFMDLNKPLTYSIVKPDGIRQSVRIFFLMKAITSTIDLIIECQQKIYLDDHFKWIQKIKELGTIWDLDINDLERHQIQELFMNGYDDMADELLEKVLEPEKIVKKLLDIAAKRLDLHLQDSRSNWKHVASGGSLLTNYLEIVKDDPVLTNVKASNLEKLYRLTYKIFQIASLKNFSDSKTL
ncbi:CLUMA_CG006543, isoform A, partial [Clunio marinus]